MTTLKDLIFAINHYPEDVFIKPNKQQVARASLAIQQAGISPDGYAAYLMRKVETNTKIESMELLDNFLAENLTPEKVHEWYLEACKRVKPKSYNQDAQKPYGDLTEEQRFLDRFIVNKIFSLLLGGRVL